MPTRLSLGLTVPYPPTADCGITRLVENMLKLGGNKPPRPSLYRCFLVTTSSSIPAKRFCCRHSPENYKSSCEIRRCWYQPGRYQHVKLRREHSLSGKGHYRFRCSGTFLVTASARNF